MKLRTTLSLLIAAILIVPACASTQDGQARPLTFEMAEEAMDAAESTARENDWDVTIVVTDGEGVPVYLRRLDGASARSYEVAMRKAHTVIATGLTTAEYGERLEAGEVDEVEGGADFPGGVPIVVNGQVVGAVATSGVAAENDAVISQAGADAVGG